MKTIVSIIKSVVIIAVLFTSIQCSKDETKPDLNPNDIPTVPENVIPGEWLSYHNDDYNEIFEVIPNCFYWTVCFHRPDNWESFKVSKVKIKTNTSGNDNIKLRCWDTEFDNGKYWPGEIMYAPDEQLNPENGWNEWDVNWTLNIDKFCVGYFQLESFAPDVYYSENSPIANKSYLFFYDSGLFYWGLLKIDLAIEIFVEPVNQSTNPTINGNGQWISGDILRSDLSMKSVQNENQKNIKENCIAIQADNQVK